MKTISKINEKIYNLICRASELMDAKSDFDTRENMIVANIKTYSWLDERDVQNVIKESLPNATEAEKEAIIEEFDENRLNSIYSHTCEMEVSYLKDMYEGNVDISDYNQIFRVYNMANNTEGKEKQYYIDNYPNMEYYINAYWDKSKKFKTLASFKKSIQKSHGECYSQWKKRSMINKFECWQYGRSGGWFSICNEAEANFETDFGYWFVDEIEKAYNQDDNELFNEVLRDNYIDDKAKFISDLTFEIKAHEEKIAAIESIIKDIEEARDNFKDTLISELENEILTFHSELDIEIKENCSIQIEEERVKTSLGATVQLEEFQTNLIEYLPKLLSMKKDEVMNIGRKVGIYFVEKAYKTDQDVIIKAGCHKFSLNNITSALNII